jgi:hypothetical protein
MCGPALNFQFWIFVFCELLNNCKRGYKIGFYCQVKIALGLFALVSSFFCTVPEVVVKNIGFPVKSSYCSICQNRLNAVTAFRWTFTLIPTYLTLNGNEIDLTICRKQPAHFICISSFIHSSDGSRQSLPFLGLAVHSRTHPKYFQLK